MLHPNCQSGSASLENRICRARCTKILALVDQGPSRKAFDYRDGLQDKPERDKSKELSRVLSTI